MKRKVVKHGPSTLTISLPSKWVKENSIKNGDELEISQENSNLIISNKFLKNEKEISVNFTNFESERYIRTTLGKIYRHGYTKINVTFDKPEIMKKIKSSVNFLIGADIIESDINNFKIRIFPLSETELNFDKSLIKMLLTLKYIFEVIKDDVQKNKFESLETIDELRHNNWRLKDFILRKAYEEKISYEEYNVLCHLTFCYEKIGSKVIGFYKRYLTKLNTVKHNKKLIPVLDKTIYFLDWLITKSSSKKPITIEDESKFRNEILRFNIYLFNELHLDKNIDHASLTIIYFTSELLDSTVSYLQIYKNNNLKFVS